MKKKIVKLLSAVLLCVALIIPFGLTSLAGSSTWDVTVDGVVYYILMNAKYTDTGIDITASARVKGYDKETVPEDVVIHPTVQSDSVYGILDCPVVGIFQKAFNGCDKMKTLTIEDNPNLKFIDEFAFCYCKNLTDIKLPDDFKEISYGMFYGCSSLTSFNFPKSVEKIATNGLSDCGFESFTVPSQIKVLDKYAFANNQKLKELSFESIPESFGEEVFANCKLLEKINFPEGIKEIYNGMFADCKGLKSIEIPNTVETISKNAFNGCTSLTDVKIPTSVKIIGEGAFSKCTSLAEINIPNSVTELELGAFEGCTALKNVKMANSIKTFGNSAFSDCTSLVSFTIPNSVTTLGSTVFSGCTSLKSVDIPPSVKTMGYGVFMKCTALTKFEIPDTVTKLGHSMFSGCTYLESVKLPDAATSYYFMFYNCKMLKKVDIGASVEDIRSAFNGCTGLRELYLPASVKTLGSSFIADCPKLSRITVDEKNPYYSSDENGILYNKNKTKLIKSPQGMGYSVSIPRSVTEIGEKAFEGCTDMKMVRISKNVTTIHYSAFYTVTKPYKTMEGITFICREGSAAYEFAQKNSIATITKCDHYDIEHIYFAPTCTKKGYRCDICKECREKFTESEYLPATGHTAGEWELSGDGKEIKKCKDCGEILETREAQPLDTNGSNQVIGEDNVGKAPTQPTSFMARLTSFFVRIFGILFRK